MGINFMKRFSSRRRRKQKKKNKQPSSKKQVMDIIIRNQQSQELRKEKVPDSESSIPMTTDGNASEEHNNLKTRTTTTTRPGISIQQSIRALNTTNHSQATMMMMSSPQEDTASSSSLNIPDCLTAEMSEPTRKFLTMYHKLLHCRQDFLEMCRHHKDCQVLARDKKPRSQSRPPTRQYRQQSRSGNTVSNIEELYQVAQIAKRVFKKSIRRIVSQVHQDVGLPTSSGHGNTTHNKNNHNDASNNNTNASHHHQQQQQQHIQIKLFSLMRRDLAETIVQKRHSNKPLPVSWLWDVVQAQIWFLSAHQILKCLELIQDDPYLRILQLDNYFQTTPLNGYPFVEVYFQVDTGQGFSHICQLELHLFSLKEYDMQRLDSQQYLGYFYILELIIMPTTEVGGGVDSTTSQCLQDLETIANGLMATREQTDKKKEPNFLVPLLDSVKEDDSRLAWIAHLLEDRLVELDWAIQANKRLWLLQVETRGHTCKDITHTGNAIAWLQKKQGRLPEAQRQFDKSLQMTRLRGGASNPYLGDGNYGLAVVLQAQGKLEEALPVYQQALEGKERILGKISLAAAQIYNAMASIQRQRGNLEEAMAQYQTSAAIYRKLLGEESIQLADLCYHMAGIRAMQSNLNEALHLNQECIRMKQKLVGNKPHRSLAQAYESLSSILQRQDKTQEALENYQIATDIKCQFLGKFHPEVAMNYETMASVQYKRGDWKEAKRLHETALEIRTKSLGKDHALVGDCYFNLGEILYRQQEYDQAAEYLQRAKRLYGAKFGNESEKVKNLEATMAKVEEKRAATNGKGDEQSNSQEREGEMNT